MPDHTSRLVPQEMLSQFFLTLSPRFRNCEDDENDGNGRARGVKEIGARNAHGLLEVDGELCDEEGREPVDGRRDRGGCRLALFGKELAVHHPGKRTDSHVYGKDEDDDGDLEIDRNLLNNLCR
jgi:hypothetical protein